jgi:hypothetical protein
VRITARFPAWWRMRDAGAYVKGVFDPLADSIVQAVGAVQVDLLQDTGAVPGPRGDLRGRAACVQPQRQGGMPQVVGAAGECGGGQAGGERGLAGSVPGAAVDRLTEHAAAGTAEQPPVRRGPKPCRCWRSMRTRTGGMGTTRMVPSGRCLRPCGSNGVPVLVQAAPVRGQAAVRMIVPRPRAGRMRSAWRRATASSGRSAA